MSHELIVADNILLPTMNNALRKCRLLKLYFFPLTGSSDSLIPGSTVVERDVEALNPNGETELQILLNTSSSRSQTLLH